MGLSKNFNYAYYPGCAAKQVQKEADWSARAVSEKLGIHLHDMPKATCCGAGICKSMTQQLHFAVNARIFSQAEEMGMDIVTICNTCLQTFAFANERLKNDPELREKINGVLKKAGVRPYEGTIDVKHLIWVMVDDIGVKKLKKHVTNPLNGLKVAPFYGCHAMRPNEVFEGRGGEAPKYLDELISVVGGESVNYNGKDKCCGFHTMLVQEDAFLSMSGGHALDARRQGAEVMISPCTLCDMALGAYQSRAEQKLGRKIELPEMNVSQLVGMAFGLDAKTLGLYRLHQDPRRVMREHGMKVS